MPNSSNDPTRPRSLCHRLPSRFKLILALAIVVLAVSIPPRHWPLSGALGCLVLMGHALAGIPTAYLLRRLAIFLPMVLLLSISLPASQGFSSGWEQMAAIFLRSTLAFITVLWLVNVMPFGELLATLRKLWVPEVVIAMLSFMQRYSFVLWDEMARMRTARQARTFGDAGLVFRWKTATHLIGMLLIRSMARAERVYHAMCARGWDGHVRTLDDPRPARPRSR